MSQNAIQLDPDYELSQETAKPMFIALYSSTEEMQQATENLEKVIEAEPARLDKLLELTLLYFELKQYDKAYQILKKAVALKPDSGQLWFLFGNCLFMLHLHEAALVAYDNALKNNYIETRLFNEKAMCLVSLNRFEDALELVNRTLATKPDSASAWQTKGVICEMTGKRDKAQNCYERVLGLIQGECSILYRLSDMGRLSSDQLEQCNPEHPIHNNKNMIWLDYANLHFAQAFEYSRKNDHDQAFVQYTKANNAIRTEFQFDQEKQTARTKQHIKYFTRELFNRIDPVPDAEISPIFIIGMPRSGTTLVEQIISSHSAIEAGGELNYISRIEQSLTAVSAQANIPYPQSISSLTRESLTEYQSQYINHLHRCTTATTQFITDKMPMNFLNLGLIGLLFPNSKIIHVKRNPLDTCLSCFFKHFTDYNNMSFSYNLEDTGHYYNEYLKLMEHWKDTIPNPIMEIQYETLIEEQERVTKSVLDFLEQSWDKTCLAFHQNKRGITTASLHQVRKPIYKTSAGRWRQYEKHIASLRQILDQ